MVSERRACWVLGQPRSTQRRELKVAEAEQQLVARMTQLASEYGRYGYLRITALLRREGWQVNHKRIERLWRREGLKVPAKQPKRRRLWLHDGSCIQLRPAYRDLSDLNPNRRKFLAQVGRRSTSQTLQRMPDRRRFCELITRRLASRGPVGKSRSPSAHARLNGTRCPSSLWRISLRCPPFAR